MSTHRLPARLGNVAAVVLASASITALGGAGCGGISLEGLDAGGPSPSGDVYRRGPGGVPAAVVADGSVDDGGGSAPVLLEARLVDTAESPRASGARLVAQGFEAPQRVCANVKERHLCVTGEIEP